MKKIAIITGLSILLILLVLQFSFYKPQYIYRVLVWQDANYDDYKKFKFNEIKKADKVFNFIVGTTEQKTQAKEKFEKQDLIGEFDAFMTKTKTNSFLVIKNDTLIIENYYGNNNKESIQTSFSVSKSILSIMIGLAIQNGDIESINDPITKYLPELEARDMRFKNISIANLLEMKSGIRYSLKTNFPFVNADDPKTYSHPNLRRVALNHTEIDTSKISKFQYNNYNALLIGLILERATCNSLSVNFQNDIWKKIGTEYDANWSADENEFEKMESGLNARAIDFAKIGRLMLLNGNWNGEQVINKDWIVNSTQSTIKFDESNYGNPRIWTYKYFWWSIPEKHKKSDFMGIGNFGQFIYVSPSTNTIIIRNGEEMDAFNDDDWTEIFYSFVNN